MKIITGWRSSNYLARFGVILIVTALIAGMLGFYDIGGDDTPPSQNLEIRTWYDLDDVRDNLAGTHTLMNNLNSTTPGYIELASPTANGGKGWEPIGNTTKLSGGCQSRSPKIYGLSGTFDGQGHEIRDLFINRPDENGVSLFYSNLDSGVIKDLGVTNLTVTGAGTVGGLVGSNRGSVINSYSSGNVTGESNVGGMAGFNHHGTVFNSYSSGNVTGSSSVGGLVGAMYYGSVNSSHSICSVIGVDDVGGLLGYINFDATVSNSYATGNVTGDSDVGGLVGLDGLEGLEETKSIIRDSYSTGNVNGNQHVGGLVGHNYYGTVSNSYATGNVTGDSDVGGLVGLNGLGRWQANGAGTVRDSYSTGNVNGNQDVGGLVGTKTSLSTVSNSFWDTETSGQATSDGGTGKNTTEMKNITTFSGVGRNIIAVALNETNPAYIWNIVNNVTYPFLSWEP